MSDVANYHDRFFKEVFSRSEVAETFAMGFLPPSVAEALRSNTFELHKGSFVDPRLKEYFSDLLYKVGLRDDTEGFLYLLFEHKSYPEPDVAYQLLMYTTRVWDSTKGSARFMRPIIPVVLYHGPHKWKVPLSFGALYRAPECLRPGLLDFTYHLCDLSSYADEEIKQRAFASATLAFALVLMKNFFTPDLSKRLREYFKLIRNMGEQTALEFLEGVLRYLGAAQERVSSQDLSEALESALGEKGEMFMESLLDKWMNEGVEKGHQQGLQQGLRQGLQQGLRQGRQAGVASLTIRQLARRFGELDGATQERVRQLSLEKLEELGEDLLDFPDKESVIEWLDRAGEAH